MRLPGTLPRLFGSLLLVAAAGIAGIGAGAAPADLTPTGLYGRGRGD
ncbi:hypothetical protein HRW12_35975, partial [Streptomyces lunaelactis]|nr:hypothetical protein [Streptomyces lunaelactis]